MRGRITVSFLAAVTLAIAAPRSHAQQFGDLFFIQTATGTIVETQLQGFFYATYDFPGVLTFATLPASGSIFGASATLHGGATIVGSVTHTGDHYFMPAFELFSRDPATNTGRIIPDRTADDGLIGCNLPTHNVGSTILYGTLNNPAHGYISTCEPGSYADVMIRLPRVLAYNGVALDVVATPEPASIALMATGILAVAGIVRRRPSIGGGA